MGIARGDKPDEIAPPVPAISDLTHLVAQMNTAGVPARLDMHGDLDLLPATTGATIYRIVQEALTNSAKHAPRAPVGIVVTVGESCVEASVDSAGTPGHGSGMGLTSMRERAEAVGGTCVPGPRRRQRLAGARAAADRRTSGHRWAMMIRVLLVDDQELIRAGLRGTA